ncbi:MAG: hypothetical protein U0175_01275 [Caldilineaceae bacterium]
MAKKKKQSTQRQKQRQQKQQRRNQRVATRGAGDYRPSPSAGQGGGFAPMYMLDLKRILASGPLSFESSKELLELAIAGEYLVKEPEFAKIAIAPLKAMAEYIKSAVDLGLEDPAELDNLPEEEREEKFEEILFETSKKLFDAQIENEVMTGLTKLRQRWRAAHKAEDLEVAAATQLILENDERGQIGYTVGLVRALVKRAVTNGFELSNAVDMGLESIEDEGLSALEVYNRISEGNDTSKFEALLQRPGMEAALDEQLKEIWDNAGKALIQNELALQIYDEEELDQAGEIWYEVQSNSTDQEGETDVAAFADGLHQALTAYLRGLFTPQRVSALKSRLDEVLHDPQYGESDHVPFLVMLREDLKEEFDFDRFSFTLFQALIGELGALTITDSDEDEEFEDSEE